MNEKLAELLRKLYGLANYDNLRTAGEVASMTPTPLGDVASGMLAVDDLRKGDYLGAAGNAVGLLPFVPAMGGVTGRYYKGMYPYDWTKEAKNYAGPVIDAKDIRRTTPFPAMAEGEKDLTNIRGFFSPSPEVASRFANLFKGGAVYPVDIDAAKILTINAKGKKAGEVQFGAGGSKFRDAVRSGKYDAVKIKNTSDEGDVFVALEGSKIESAFE